MAKYEDLYPDTEEMITQMVKIIDENNLIKLEMKSDNKQKQVIKLVKSNDLNKEIGKYDVAIIVNEEIFDKLPEPIQILSLDEALTALSYNHEKDKVELRTEDVKTHSGFLSRYGYEQFHMMTESIKATYAQVAEEKNIQKDSGKTKSKKY